MSVDITCLFGTTELFIFGSMAVAFGIFGFKVLWFIGSISFNRWMK